MKVLSTIATLRGTKWPCVASGYLIWTAQMRTIPSSQNVLLDWTALHDLWTSSQIRDTWGMKGLMLFLLDTICQISVWDMNTLSWCVTKPN